MFGSILGAGPNGWVDHSMGIQWLATSIISAPPLSQPYLVGRTNWESVLHFVIWSSCVTPGRGNRDCLSLWCLFLQSFPPERLRCPALIGEEVTSVSATWYLIAGWHSLVDLHFSEVKRKWVDWEKGEGLGGDEGGKGNWDWTGKKMMDWLINEKRKEEFLSFIHWIQQAMFMKIEDITHNHFSSLQLSWSDLNILVRNVGWSYCLLQVVMNYMIRKKSLVSLNFPNVVGGLLKILEHFFSDQSDVILLSKQEKFSWFFEMLGENRSIQD